MPSSAPRSVADLLPRPFDALTIDDVRKIVMSHSEEGESLFFARKVKTTSQTLAKSCAAFANTYGGLLVVGSEDDTNELVGIDRLAEPQVWVKDVLRHHVLPLPSFRARWIPLKKAKSHGVLLVLVEESSTTPHLLTRSGAIYVRNPGSSDPVPISDQVRLLELSRRGREARASALNRANEMLDHHSRYPLFRLGLAPTGVASDAVRDIYEGHHQIDLLTDALALFDTGSERSSTAELSRPEWALRRVRLSRRVQRSFEHDPEVFLDTVVLDSDCDLLFERALIPERANSHPEPRGSRPLYLYEAAMGIIPWFRQALQNGRELIGRLGGHGDLRVCVQSPDREPPRVLG
jgi:hypothetical protein